ncbi:outer membrane protein assembly factor BamB family protein [Roseivivax sediminis]|uniref:Outer membrane protein assembly factor BamB, contains PQQ-like beta-propeller repeat n=1 Tax=Roseivivax sediminis TaxID=936889 RepID=A0A1I1VIJ9_9RHOB|nr:PQQ-binding-like beta-propeller repeat protein [Roseivivax sediminis]SFD80893.1 Outer membrane protein assembly factor BamB, contains PQQ-like beta-propeller repeat [Roseivivax sediminis]
MAKLLNLALMAGVTALAACGEREVILPGERLGIREVLQTQPSESMPGPNRAVPAALPGAVQNGAWTQSQVSPHARVEHAALSLPLQPLWSVDIGQGDVKRQRLNTDPVSDGSRIYVMSSDFIVSAISPSGAVLWQTSLVPRRDQSFQAQGGGLALGGGRLFVSTGFGELTALDPASGGEVWSQRLQDTATGAPSYRDGLVYITSGDSVGWAIEAPDGRIRWRADGVPDIANVAGAPAPAIGAEQVVFAFGDGNLQARFRQGGNGIWSEIVGGSRRGRVLSRIDDMTGDPTIAGNTVYAGTHSGRFTARSMGSGEDIWTIDKGAFGPPLVAGNSVYFLSDLDELVRVDRETGAQVWAADLPGWKRSARPSRRRDSAFANHGPVLAGGQLWVASSDGALRAFAPEDGRLVAQVPVEGGATASPIVVNGTLYVVTADGALAAYR